ncbi:tagaturonate reductase [Neolewinella aurantiaca]|uniref:Tagaturonate reductase n=1 Tax=Neolewinella aurantiaca TaxID=2602767 RepID=A0A5C7FNG8_9BACT|nr:tagaturonate reductase [Neolewinella aurantiaca]TXF87930.1 tagaturonate reductase [Neolewinella aurantiaca]
MLNPQDFDRPQRPLRILQFGGGNFLRAFVDWMIDVLNEQTDFNGGVVIVKPTSRGDYTELRAQHGLFSVALDGIRKGELISDRRVVTCVQQVIQPYTERAAYLATAELPGMRFVISNTTEAGIRFREEPLPEEGMPTEFPAKLCLWLHHRFQHFGAAGRGRGCIVLPLELIGNNGDELRECILKYAVHWGLSDAFRQWIQEENHFCNTLVDRIVSGYPADRAAAIAAETGHTDPLLVAGEYYHSWVISGPPQVAEELPFSDTDLNVTFTDDLDAYREIKVRILNGAHTSIVPTGYLAGLETVGDVMADAEMSAFLDSVLNDEIIPSLDYPEAELKAFAADVLDRFRNPSIHHKLMDISLNSTSKFRTRLLPSLLAYQKKKGELPAGIVRAFAALIRFYRGDRNGAPIALRDAEDRITFLQQEWSRVTANEQTTVQLARNVLSKTDWWGTDLNEVPGLTDALSAGIQKYQA